MNEASIRKAITISSPLNRCFQPRSEAPSIHHRTSTANPYRANQ